MKKKIMKKRSTKSKQISQFKKEENVLKFDGCDEYLF